MVRSLLLFVAVLFFSAGCDQAAKQLAIDRLAGAPPISLVGDTVRLELAANPGGFLSLGAGLPLAIRRILFVVLVPAFVLVVAVLTIRSGAVSAPAITGLGLVVGGGLGNWIDRVVHGGAVTDFVSVGFAGLRTGIFNLADVWILAGLLLLASARSGRETK
jgi:signal peptidase II